MAKKMKQLIIVVNLLILSGCAFTHDRIEKQKYGHMFTATRGNIEVISNDSRDIPGGVKFINVVDIPFSVLTDVVLLPIDLAVMIGRDGMKKESMESE
jgi:uncharacterized protein YceK